MASEEARKAVPAPPRTESPVAIPIAHVSALEDQVRQLEEAVRGARSMPLSSSALIDRAAILAMVEAIKRSIPEEIARARALMHDREQVLEAARREAGRLIEKARWEREKLLDRAEIVQAASREADRVIAQAEAASRQIRRQADEYVEGKLATFEVVLQRTLAAIERGRARLAGRMEADDLAEQEPPEEGGGQPTTGT